MVWGCTDVHWDGLEVQSRIVSGLSDPLLRSTLNSPSCVVKRLLARQLSLNPQEEDVTVASAA